MKQSTILQRICPGDWYAKAYSEYLQDVANNLVTFKENISAFIMDATEQFDDAGLNPDNDDDIQNFINDVISDYPNIQLDAMYPFNEGYLSGKDMLKSIIKVYCDGSNVDEFSTLDSLRITSKTGALTDVNLSMSSLLQEISEMIHSSALSAAALKASSFQSLTDKITSFKNTFSSFTQGELNFGNIDVSYFNSLLESTGSSEQFLLSWVNATNIDEIADESNSMTYQDSMIAKYTGANPLLAADFSTIMSTASTIVATGTKVVKGIFSAVKNLGKSLFKKAKKFLTDTIIDPTFIGYDNSENLENCVDGFLYQGSANLGQMCYNFVSPDFIDTQSWNDTYDSFAHYSTYKDDAIFKGWIKIKTIFGNILFKYRIDDFDNEFLDYKLQPLLINPNSPIYADFTAFISVSNEEYSNISERDFLYDKFVELIDKSFSNYTISDMYPTQNITKSEFISAMNLSLQLLASIIPYILYETISLVSDSVFVHNPLNSNGHISVRCNDDFSNYGYYQWNTAVTPNGVPSNLCTNLVAFQFSTGYSPSYEEYMKVLPGLVYDEVVGDLTVRSTLNNGNINVMAVMLFYCYMLSRIDRRMHPTDYVFLPFCAGTEDLDHGKWSIKTDEQINNAFNSFIAAAIIVVITVVVLSAAAVTLKKIANVRLKKQLERKSQLDSKMWNGEKLTSKEYRKYKRLSRKIDASKILNGSSGSGISLNDSNNAGSVSNDIILLINRLIMGQE